MMIENDHMDMTDYLTKIFAHLGSMARKVIDYTDAKVMDDIEDPHIQMFKNIGICFALTLTKWTEVCRNGIPGQFGHWDIIESFTNKDKKYTNGSEELFALCVKRKFLYTSEPEFVKDAINCRYHNDLFEQISSFMEHLGKKIGATKYAEIGNDGYYQCNVPQEIKDEIDQCPMWYCPDENTFYNHKNRLDEYRKIFTIISDQELIRSRKPR